MCRSRRPLAATAAGLASRVMSTERFFALASTADEPALVPPLRDALIVRHATFLLHHDSLIAAVG